MRLWRGNRIDGEWEISAEEIAELFWKARDNDPDLEMQLDRALRGFITSPNGLNSVWTEEEEDDYYQALEATLRAWPERVGS